MLKCRNCGNPIPDGTTICSSCGSPVEDFLFDSGKPGFATFIGKAPLGRKLGAVMTWLAAVLLIVSMFVPFLTLKYDTELDAELSFKVEPSITAAFEQEDEEEASSGDAEADDAEAESDGADRHTTLVELFAPSEETTSISLFTLLTNDAPALANGGVLYTVVLVVWFVLAAALVILALFTMTPVCLVPAAAAMGIGVWMYVAFGGFVSKLNDQLVTDQVLEKGSALFSTGLHIGFWLLIVALVLQVVGLVLHLVLRPAESESEFDYAAGQNGEVSEDAYAETSLLDEDSSDTGAKTAAAPHAVATLKRLNSGEVFTIFEMSDYVIGKEKSRVEIYIDNAVVSRTHARISCQNGSCHIEDLHSTNGTFVNDQRLTPDIKVVLDNGVYISFGNEVTQFKYL